MHFLHSGARIKVFEQKRKHKSPLKITQNVGKILLFFLIKSWPTKACVLWRMFLMLVVKYKVISQSNTCVGGEFMWNSWRVLPAAGPY